MLSFSKDSKVWVENISIKEYKDEKEEPYFLATVVNIDEKKGECEVKYVTLKKNNEKVKFERIVPFINDVNINVNDMAAVEDINEIDLLNNMKNRFFKKNIFTNVGPTLIIINPYQKVESAFSHEKIEHFIKYHHTSKVVEERKSLEEPHLYDVTMIAIRRLIELKRNQAIIISGESGAGKTETAKNAMECITYFFGKASGSEKSNEPSLEHKILSCNPILEAFGNAKTVRNDNSSRFGKYVTINLDVNTGKIEGAQIQTYLLEKSRICEPSEGERNYHIFYHLLKADENLLNTLHLKPDPSSYKILAVSKCFAVDTINDEKLFRETEEAFKVTGFSPDEIMAVYKIVAACLLLGNVTFKDAGGDKTIVDDKMGVFNKVCDLLQVNVDTLESALTNNVRIIQGNFIKSPLRVADSNTFKNSFTKELYNRMFNWLVKKLNNKLCKPINKEDPNKKYIGLLDIFGFECFNINSLEQMCINYTNEKLQQLYINDVFKAELNEYIKEGLQDSLSLIKFKDNKGVIELMDKAPMGLFQLLDETCMTNSDDKAYLSKISKPHLGNPNFKIPKLSQNKYAIIHTAKDVEYTVTGYVSKNLDEVKITMVECIQESSNPLIKYIFMNCLKEEEYKEEFIKAEEDRKNKSKKPTTEKYLSAKFRKEMETLMNELSSCECNYIRCLKPNEMKKKEFFIPTFVFQQIRYLGVLDTIRIRKDGFPSRKTYKDFLLHFEEICYWKEKKNFDYYRSLSDEKEIKELALKCLEVMFPRYSQKELLLGINRIMMKSAFYLRLELDRENKIKKRANASLMIAKFWKMSKVMKKYFKIRKGAKFLINWYRNQRYKMKIQKMRYGAKTIQKIFKGIMMRRTIDLMKKCVMVLQKNIKMFIAKVKFEKKKNAGRKINSYMKIFLKRCRIARKRKMRLLVNFMIEKAWFFIVKKMKFFSAIRIQAHVRGFLTKVNNLEIVEQGREKRKWFVEDRASKVIQRIYKGYRIRIALKIANIAAYKLQSHWKMTKLEGIIRDMREKSIIIQNNVKSYIYRKKVFNERLYDYFKEEEPYLNRNNIECDKFLFPNKSNNNGLYANSNSKPNIFDPFLPKKEPIQPKRKVYLPKPMMLNDPKIVLFAKILDLDFNIDSCEIYDEHWAREYEKIYNYNIDSNSPIQQIAIGGCHTILLNSKGKVFSWGWNNYGQCCLSSQNTLSDVLIPKIFKDKKGNIPCVPFVNYLEAKTKPITMIESEIKQVICFDDYTFLIDLNNTAWGCGNNTKGQLGLGHMWDVPGPTPILGDLKGKVKKIYSTGNINIAATTCGEMYVWGLSNDRAYKPIRYNFKARITVNSVSCGGGFVVILSNQGTLFSFGTSNKQGELGTGDFLPRSHPEPIIIENEKIVQISCGFKHTIAKGSSGRVYSWGLNSSGQLGIGNYLDSCVPVNISFDNLYPYRVKILQVAASFRSSFFLTESRSILCCGTTGELKSEKFITKLNLKIKTPEVSDENSYSPLKITSSWTRSFSLFYAIFGDISEINNKVTSRQKVNVILNTLSSKWDTDTMEPPYIETISGYFSSVFMKKKNEEKKIMKKRSYVEEMKAYIKK